MVKLQSFSDEHYLFVVILQKPIEYFQGEMQYYWESKTICCYIDIRQIIVKRFALLYPGFPGKSVIVV